MKYYYTIAKEYYFEHFWFLILDCSLILLYLELTIATDDILFSGDSFIPDKLEKYSQARMGLTHFIAYAEL